MNSWVLDIKSVVANDYTPELVWYAFTESSWESLRESSHQGEANRILYSKISETINEITFDKNWIQTNEIIRHKSYIDIFSKIAKLNKLGVNLEGIILDFRFIMKEELIIIGKLLHFLRDGVLTYPGFSTINFTNCKIIVIADHPPLVKLLSHWKWDIRFASEESNVKRINTGKLYREQEKYGYSYINSIS